MVNYSLVPQGTDLWLSERCGLLTASDFAKAMGKKGATRDGLLHRKRSERRTGHMEGIKQSDAMKHGNETEPEARDYASFMLGVDIEEVGLATNDKYPGLGASLDGLIGGNVGVEIKCPMPHTHDSYLDLETAPSKYKWQIHGQMLVCELDAVWFCSYCPTDTRQLLVRVDRDEDIIQEMKETLGEFLSDLKAMEDRING